MSRPTDQEYQHFFRGYIEQVAEDDILPVLRNQGEIFGSLIDSIDEERAIQVDPPYAWSFKQVIGHIIDAEQIFGYRALRFIRKDTTPLAPFDENWYVSHADFDRLTQKQLSFRFCSVRNANIALFESLTEDDWSFQGQAGPGMISVRGLAYVIAGHLRHHEKILRQRLDASPMQR